MIPAYGFHVFLACPFMRNRTGCNPGGVQPVDWVWGAGAAGRNRPAAAWRDLEGVAYTGVDAVVG